VFRLPYDYRHPYALALRIREQCGLAAQFTGPAAGLYNILNKPRIWSTLLMLTVCTPLPTRYRRRTWLANAPSVHLFRTV